MNGALSYTQYTNFRVGSPSKSQAWVTNVHLPGPTLILAVLQPSNSQCIAHSTIIKASYSMQISCILMYVLSQKLGNSWNFWGFPVVFPSLIFRHSKLGIPFILGQKGRLMLLHVPGSAPHLGQLESTCENHGGLHNLNEMSVVRN